MKKKILLALLMVIVLLGVGVGYAYFATDAFKSEKEMFFSYILEDNMLENLQDEKVTEYVQKQQNTSYTNKGEISLDMEADDISVEAQILANTKITLEGKTDTNKELTEQTITLDLGQGFNIPVNLKVDGEVIGIQSNFLNSKYIAVRNENLRALFEKFGLETEEIPNKIELSQQEFTEEELQTLENKYMSILNDNLEEELFSKEKIDKQKIITLRVPEQKLVDTLIKILEIARNDELLLGKKSGIYEKEELQNEIDKMINELKESETSETNIFEMKLYIENKDVNKYEIAIIEDDETTMLLVIENKEAQVVIKMYDESELLGELNISKETSESNVAYNVSMKLYDEIDGDVEVAFNIQYKNLAALDNVEENCQMTISVEEMGEEGRITLNYNNTTTFNSNLEIEGLNEDNAIILNDATEQELQNLIMSIYQNLGLMF